MKLPIVNEQDEIIDFKDRGELNQNDIIRIAGLWIFNSNNEVLIAQRSFDKKNDPGKWAPSVGGTVEQGESYLENIIKEVHEELGITAIENELIKGPYGLGGNEQRYFCQVFFLKNDSAVSDFVLQEDEVEAVQWISLSDLQKWFSEKPEDFLGTFAMALNDIMEFMNK